MYIKHVDIINYRNLKEISVSLEKTTAIIGKNNSGKSNFLNAITLPLAMDEVRSRNKRLYLGDFNNDVKEVYYNYISNHREEFTNNTINKEEFSEVIPKIEVTIEFAYENEEYFLLRDFITNLSNRTPKLKYSYYCKSEDQLIQEISDILNSTEEVNIDDLKINLLPIELYEYSIYVPNKNKQVSYEKLKKFTYNFITDTRDDFSNNDYNIGSKNLVNLLNNKLTNTDKIELETEYNNFFEIVKNLTNMDEVFNWQEYSDIENARDFFDKITILPNMPPMYSLLNSVTLGYDDLNISNHGLGYRNLIFLLVMINSLQVSNDSYYSLLNIEEPEAHISYDNQQIIKSYISNVSSNTSNLQIIYSTHDSNLINKMKIDNIILFNDNNAYSFSNSMGKEQMEYIIRNPNLDLFKLFFSRKCILVEGITEELFIRTYLSYYSNQLHNIEVISFHKGYTEIIKIWKTVNADSQNQLGIIRDFDDQPTAQRNHEELRDDNIFIETTSEYSFEEELINTDDNFNVLKRFFVENYSVEENINLQDLLQYWKEGKSKYILGICNGILNGSLEGLTLPQHINTVLNQMGLRTGEMQ